ncbi:hypothetical protein ANN_15138 [Periplaneta americana]|uniref:Uncharacterized protein n=1 Tax=Periplaneta americana TaxID=6978 RepID=A0ABQ8SY88_PERAM|nr:hypothetical protein ANN_15138 [Periplaneta americana]
MAGLCEGGNEPPGSLKARDACAVLFRMTKLDFKPVVPSVCKRCLRFTSNVYLVSRAGDGAVRFGAVTVTSLLG